MKVWKIFKVEREYHRIATDRGDIIEEIIKIEKDSHFIFEDAGSSTQTIQKLIKQGEKEQKRYCKIKKMKNRG